MDKVRSSELHGELGYSYADRANYAQYLYEQEMNRIELNHYVSTCLCLSEGASVEKTLNNIHAINEAISDKINNAWEKILDFLKRMWGKFTESLNSMFSNNNEYLERYKDIILKKPIKCCKQLVMNDLVEAAKRIIRHEVPVINSAMLDQLPDKEDDQVKLNAVRTRLVADWQNGGNKKMNPEGKEFQAWLVDYFKGADLEKEIAVENFNMTDAYNFCKDSTAIYNALKKDVANVEKSNNEFIAEIKKIQADAKNAQNQQQQTGEQQNGEKEETEEEKKKRLAAEVAEKAKAAQEKRAAAEKAAAEARQAELAKAKGQTTVKPKGENANLTANSLVQTWLNELQMNGSAEPKDSNGTTGTTVKSNVASTTNNGLSDQDKANAADLAANNTEDAVKKMETKANIYINIGKAVATAKMNSVEFITREYMTIIKAHVAYYVGREGIEQDQQTKAGTDFSTENRRAQEQNAQEKTNAQGEGARLSSDNSIPLNEGGWQALLAFTNPITGAGWLIGTTAYFRKLLKDKKYGKLIAQATEKTVTEAKRKNRNLTEKMPEDFSSQFAANNKASSFIDDFGYMPSFLMKQDPDAKAFSSVVGKYHVVIIHDTDSVKAIKVCLYDKETKDAKWFNVPAPTK